MSSMRRSGSVAVFASVRKVLRAIRRARACHARQSVFVATPAPVAVPVPNTTPARVSRTAFPRIAAFPAVLIHCQYRNMRSVWFGLVWFDVI